MKQKFTITIADIEMNVVCDESPEAVEAIVGILDRKMREIALHSRRCSKNEAALLCALDYCAENIGLRKELNSLRKENEALARRNEDLKKKLEAPVQLQMDIAAEEAPVKECEPAEEIAPVTAPKEERKKVIVKPQKRVRSMFDLISFDNE